MVPPAQRFWAKVHKTAGDCWLWFGAHVGHGSRGGFQVSGTPYRWCQAEKYAYELVFGEPPSPRHRATYGATCGTEGCINPLHAVYRVGNPRVVVDPLLKDTARFFSWVQIDPVSRCWLWHGRAVWTSPTALSPIPYFYGGVSGGLSATEPAYRFAWRVVARRAIPPGHALARTCDTELCVNPDHRACVDEQHVSIHRDRRHGFRTRVAVSDRGAA